MKTLRAKFSLRQTKKSKININASSNLKNVSIDINASIDGRTYKETYNCPVNELNNIDKKQRFKEILHAFDNSTSKLKPYDLTISIHEGSKNVFLLDIDNMDPVSTEKWVKSLK